MTFGLGVLSGVLFFMGYQSMKENRAFWGVWVIIAVAITLLCVVSRLNGVTL